MAERVKGFCHVVGLSYAGFEDKLMSLFNDIEAHHYYNGVGHENNLSTKFGNQGQHEVKRLECSVNYDGKGGQSSRLARKGGLVIVNYEAQDNFLECARHE
jgi:hypothetical protein